MTIGIYMITNSVTSEIYIGQSSDIAIRIGRHKHFLKYRTHKNTHLQASYNKYGVDNFKFEQIEECQPEMLTEREQYWMDFYQSYEKGYNQTPAAGSTFGYKSNLNSEQENNRRSNISAGYKNRSDEKTVERLSKINERFPVKPLDGENLSIYNLLMSKTYGSEKWHDVRVEELKRKLKLEGPTGHNILEHGRLTHNYNYYSRPSGSAKRNGRKLSPVPSIKEMLDA